MEIASDLVFGILGVESQKHSKASHDLDASKEQVIRALEAAIAVQNAAAAICAEIGVDYQDVYMTYFHHYG